MVKRAAFLILAAIVSSHAFTGTRADTTSRVEVSHFSGKPVPRFEHLRFAAVNGRAGPSQRHRVVWRYERTGLPVLVIKESHDWRRVRDPDGDEVWIHARMLAPERRVLVVGEGELRARPQEGARVVARLTRGLVAGVASCRDEWCHISLDGRQGWFPRARLWGTRPAEAPV